MDSNQTNEKTEYSGTPEEVGAQLFVDALAPTIDAAMKTSTSKQVVQLIAGMLAAMAGIVADNYGAEAAVEILRGTADNVERAEKAKTPH